MVICSWLAMSSSPFTVFVWQNRCCFLGNIVVLQRAMAIIGLKIDLNANFRSRKEVLDATNFVFAQVMGARVGEIDYDDAAALKYGAHYPDKA